MFEAPEVLQQPPGGRHRPMPPPAQQSQHATLDPAILHSMQPQHQPCQQSGTIRGTNKSTRGRLRSGAIAHPDTPRTHHARHQHVCAKPVAHDHDLVRPGDEAVRRLRQILEYLAAAAGLLGHVAPHAHACALFECICLFSPLPLSWTAQGREIERRGAVHRGQRGLQTRCPPSWTRSADARRGTLSSGAQTSPVVPTRSHTTSSALNTKSSNGGEGVGRTDEVSRPDVEGVGCGKAVVLVQYHRADIWALPLWGKRT